MLVNPYFVSTFIGVLTFLGIIMMGYISIHVRLKVLETEVDQLKKKEDATDKKFEQIMEKISLVHQNFNDLLIEFANFKK